MVYLSWLSEMVCGLAVQSRSRIYTESIKERWEINHQRSLDGLSSFASSKSLLLIDYCKQSSRLHSVSTFSFERNKESERFKKTHRLLYILVNEFREILYSLENFLKKAFGLLVLALPGRQFSIGWCPSLPYFRPKVSRVKSVQNFMGPYPV